MSGKIRLTFNPSLCYFIVLLNCLSGSSDAEVAQLVEQRPEKPRVRSSILRLGTILSNISIPKLEILNKTENSNI
jgi:hypothetical protein